MAKSYPRKIILALVFFVLLLTIGCATPRAYIGVELDAYNLVKKVVPDKPAQQAGIRPGDIVLGIKKDKIIQNTDIIDNAILQYFIPLWYLFVTDFLPFGFPFKISLPKKSLI